MKLEDLANELLIDIFEYIDFIQLLQAFYNLNSRLNKLIFNHYRLYHLNFRSISKREFNLICQKHFSSIFHQIISLQLSNNDETPNLFELFLSYNFNFNQFYHLQSLSFESIHSLRILNQILFQCQNLPYLTHLYILKCHFKEQEQFSYLIKNIWNLPKLQYCQIDHQFPYGLKFTNTATISFSIENLCLENFTFDYNELSNLFQCTPSLRHLNISMQSQSNCKHKFSCIIPSSITSIKLSYRNSLNSMLNLFEKLPNLFRLIIQMKYIYLDGYEWKKIIENYFPKLKIFQLKMNFKLHHSSRIEEELDELLNSFQTTFWIEEHQWFVRCDGILSNMNHLGILYTLPYAFEEFLLTNKFWSKSTGSIENEYDYVNTLTIMNIKNNFYKDSSGFFDNFQNISHLKIHLPLNNNIWLFIQSLNQLISLDITLIEGFSILPLQNLLDQSSYLTSLCFANFNNSQIISQLTCPSIYRLDFLNKNRYKRYFDTIQCSILINSSLGRQCKILLIYVENRINILQLIQNMSNLQSLICQCKDDQYNTELIQWLYDYLSSTCLIMRDKYQQKNIRLWIK